MSKRKAPPAFCRRVFRFFIPEQDRIGFQAGLDEAYRKIRLERGRGAADRWYRMQLLRSLPDLIISIWGGYQAMFKNFFRAGLRNLQRHRGYAALNILGLAVGLAVCQLIFLWVRHEWSFDRFHADADRIFRVLEHEEMSNGDVLSYTQQSPELAAVLKADFPEIEESVRIEILRDRLVRHGERRYFEKGFAFVDPAFLTMFSFPLWSGDPKAVLSAPSSIVITRRAAEKYFGEADPIGKTLNVDNHRDFVVEGVLDDIPSRSHLRFDFLVQFDNIKDFDREISGWDSFYLDTYVRLAPKTRAVDVDPKIRDVIGRYSEGSPITLSLQPLTRIRLYSNTVLTTRQDGDIRYVVLFSMIAVFILLNACINFMNLSTARSGLRAREIGMRKVVGARRGQLMRQFFGESLMTAFISLLLAAGLVVLALPAFNRLSGKELVFSDLAQWQVAAGFFFITLAAGLISGIYPAFFLSAFQPVGVLRRSASSGTRGGGFRRILVIFQFAVTAVLILGTVMVFRQLTFLRNQNLGFNKEHVVCFKLPFEVIPRRESLQTALERIPGVVATTASSFVPGNRGALLTLDRWEGRDSEDRIELGHGTVDPGFLSTLELKMVEGRFFSRDFATDIESAVVLNQAAVRAMGMADPVGKWILGPQLKIIGVMEDFHVRSLHYKVAPLALLYRPDQARHILVKIGGEDVPRALSDLRGTWDEVIPDFPLQSRFLDENLEQLYRADRSLGRIVNVFSGLALFVACLGLFGLASYVAERRRREIGIRRVLGASIPGVCGLLTGVFFRWILAANLIAAPLAAFAVRRYLALYAYRTGLTLPVFLLPIGITAGIALLTIGWQVVRAAAADPVKTLRHE